MGIPNENINNTGRDALRALHYSPCYRLVVCMAEQSINATSDNRRATHGPNRICEITADIPDSTFSAEGA